MEKPILIDVMLNNHFVCQIKYTKRGFPKMIGGRISEVHDMNDIKRFIEQKRPSLKGKPYEICFSTQSL